MRIRIVCPAPSGSRSGNRRTALRWRGLLQALGHRVEVTTTGSDRPCDLLVALHATRSAEAVARSRRGHPQVPIVVALTGTDLYCDLPTSPVTRRSLHRASRVIVLQEAALRALPRSIRAKARVIHQSAKAPRTRGRRSTRHFDVAVVGHLRAVKDPFRAEEAVRAQPSGSRIRVRHAGRALDPGLAREARARERRNPRYRWLGEMPGWKARQLIARSRLLVHSSLAEGGANVISEALVAGVPVIASRIPGNEGLLGASYPGLFPVGRTTALRALLIRAETDRRFLARLTAWCRRRSRRFTPRRERLAWKALIAELVRNSRSTPREARAAAEAPSASERNPRSRRPPRPRSAHRAG